MDRVTRYPIFSNPHSARVTGLAVDEDGSYTIELVGVGPATGWSQGKPQTWSPVERASVSYGSRAIHSQPLPRSLYLEDENDREVRGYRLDTPSSRLQDLECQRRAIIQGQAVRRPSTVVSISRTPDSGDPTPLGQPQAPLPMESSVDSGQIDFLAARQQFLSLEQANANSVPQSPATRAPLAWTPPAVSQTLKAPNGPLLANGHTVPTTTSTTSPAKAVIWEGGKARGFSAGSNGPALIQPGSPTRAESPETPKETPIEREIRLAQEREADLRAQRGLQRDAGQQELVHIRSKPLLNKVTPVDTAPRRDRSRPSLYVQRDMVQETQREEDHRREGLQVGRAPTPNWASADPEPQLRRSQSSDCILSPTPDARAADPAPEPRKVNRIPLDAYQPYLGSGNPRPESSAFQVYGKLRSVSTTEDAQAATVPKPPESPRYPWESSRKPLSTKQERLKPAGGPRLANGGIVRWEYFRLRPLRFKVRDEPPQAETPSTWGWEMEGTPAVRLQRSQSSELLEKEVQSVLRREREVAEERRSALFPEVFFPTQDDVWEHDSRSSSRASGITGSYSVCESPTFTPVHLHSGLGWTAEASVDGVPGQRKRKELWYAGIDPVDEINSEVLGSTRVTRHKSAMAERWEAGIYFNED